MAMAIMAMIMIMMTKTTLVYQSQLAKPPVQTSGHHQYQKLCIIHTCIHNQMNHIRHYKVHKSLDKRE